LGERYTYHYLSPITSNYYWEINMNILITGGCGFIGSHIVDRAINMGYTVSVIDNLSTGNITNLNPKARFYEADIRDKKVEKILEKENPGVVFHLAAQINVRISEEDPFTDTDINIKGSINISKSESRKMKAVKTRVIKQIFFYCKFRDTIRA